MSADDQIWIGVDPGGKERFGVAILFPDGTTATSCVDHADAAVDTISSYISSVPAGIGVDAPLWWSSGASGDRRADQWIRTTYGLSGGNVQTANSLRGAALIQGAMFVYRIREKYCNVRITESHPKAVWVALQLSDWDVFCQRYSISASIRGDQEHERDAILAALSAREGFEGRWRTDLSLDRNPSELDPATYWLSPVQYFWPNTP